LDITEEIYVPIPLSIFAAVCTEVVYLSSSSAFLAIVRSRSSGTMALCIQLIKNLLHLRVLLGATNDAKLPHGQVVVAQPLDEMGSLCSAAIDPVVGEMNLIGPTPQRRNESRDTGGMLLVVVMPLVKQALDDALYLRGE
jgi:hypothetical protein